MDKLFRYHYDEDKKTLIKTTKNQRKKLMRKTYPETIKQITEFGNNLIKSVTNDASIETYNNQKEEQQTQYVSDLGKRWYKSIEVKIGDYQVCKTEYDDYGNVDSVTENGHTFKLNGLNFRS